MSEVTKIVLAHRDYFDEMHNFYQSMNKHISSISMISAGVTGVVFGALWYFDVAKQHHLAFMLTCCLLVLVRFHFTYTSITRERMHQAIHERNKLNVVRDALDHGMPLEIVSNLLPNFIIDSPENLEMHLQKFSLRIDDVRKDLFKLDHSKKCK